MQPNTMPEYPGHAPSKRRPAYVLPAALAAGGLIAGSLFTGLIVNANNQARIDHCNAALDTSGEALVAAGDALTAASTFDIAGLDRAGGRISDLDTPEFHDDADECRGA